MNLVITVPAVIAFLLRSYIKFILVVLAPRIIRDVIPAPIQYPFYKVYEVAFNLFYWADKAISLLVPGRYWKPGRSISYRAGRWLAEGNLIARIFCAFLHPFDNNHCENAARFDDGNIPFFKWFYFEELISELD